jgi:hypothetical protein
MRDIHMRTRTKLTAAIGVALTAVLAGGLVTTMSAATEAASTAAGVKRDIALILDYTVKKSCPVYPNYPKAGVKGNNINWTISTSDIVGWRYNVNSTWSMISDKKYRNTGHVWWGFVHRDCIGTSVGGEHFPTPTSHYPAGKAAPTRVLRGRSAQAKDHYRSVDFRVSAGHVVNDHARIDSFGTLRDAANRFVIGNVFPKWHVHKTNQQSHGWVKVYVPNAKRWGWVQNTHF